MPAHFQVSRDALLAGAALAWPAPFDREYDTSSSP